MKRILSAINLKAAQALNCKAVSIDDDNIIRPSIQTELIKRVEDRETDENLTVTLDVQVCFYPEENKKKEVDLINSTLLLSKAFNTPLDCGDFLLNVLHREYEYTLNKELLFNISVTYTEDVDQADYDNMLNLDFDEEV